MNQLIKPIGSPLTKDEQHVLGFLGKRGGLVAGSFTTALIDAMMHADDENLSKLHTVFPELADAVLSWKLGNLFERSDAYSKGE